MLGMLTNHVQHGQCSKHNGEPQKDFNQGRDKFGFDGSGCHMRRNRMGTDWRLGDMGECEDTCKR